MVARAWVKVKRFDMHGGTCYHLMMHVLWTSPHCRPDWLDRLGEESQGGQTVVMNRLPHALARADSDLHIDIFTRLQDDDPHADERIKLLDDDPRVRLIRLPCGPTDRYIPKELLYGEYIGEFVDHIVAFSAAEGIEYDLLHGHYADGWETVVRLKDSWPSSPPVLLTTHSLGRRKLADGLERGEGTAEELDLEYNFAVRVASEERSLSVADFILPLSTPEAGYMVDHYAAVQANDPRLTVIPNGIDPVGFPMPPAEAQAELRDRLRVADGVFLLVVPSRVDPRKGQKNLLRALELGRDALQGYDLQVLFLAWPDAPTPYSEQLEGIISGAGLEQWVLRHPPVPRQRMPVFVTAADGVALPSQEYFSIAMLEAMLLERPLIASVHSSGVDVINDGEDGLLVDHNDPQALLDALIVLLELSPSGRQEMGRRARARVLEGYTWRQVAQKTLDAYRRAAQASR